MVLDRGTLVNNRYRVVEILGQGGMGSVYRAVDENLGVDVALKENLFTTDEYARQFRREAVILATLRHPNLTRVTDHFVIENQGQYLVMDYIEGEDLRQRMDRVGLLNEDEVVIIGAAICDALNYLHTRIPPIVHRDIKPGNVKITPHGQIYLVDFGLAKIIQTGQATTTGARAMTPGYSPPEQYGTARTDHRSDLFSLGATLYAALTGVIPEDALARAMDQVELTSTRKRNPKISRRMASVIEKSLAVRPDDRYQDAEEFKQALLSIRGITTRRKAGEYVVSPPPELPSDGNVQNPILLNDTAEEYIPRAEVRSPPSLPLALPAEQQLILPARKRRGSIWPIMALSMLLLSLTGLAMYNFNPGWPGQLLSILVPSGNAPPVIAVASPSPTAIEATPVNTNTVAPLPTIEASPTLPATAPPRPTSTRLVPSPTSTATLVPTPAGGGSGQIAFASDRSGTTQVWLVNIDGSGEPMQVTNMPEGACQPAWSPDGMRLVFISPCSKNLDSYPGGGLFLINIDGSGLTPLPTVPGGDYDPVWSPDGNFIAFTSLRNSGRPRIYAIDLRDDTVTRLSGQYAYDRQPAWSPDGKRIAFVTTQKGPYQIWTMNADGSNPLIFTRSADAINNHPVWSLDGELILFTQVDSGGGPPFLVAASYKEGDYNEYRYTLGPWPIREARYSPDGLWLVFESWPEGSNHDIYIMSASGAARTQLTNWERLDFDPVWRPALPQP
jgi:serine/threonine protein kinase